MNQKGNGGLDIGGRRRQESYVGNWERRWSEIGGQGRKEFNSHEDREFRTYVSMQLMRWLVVVGQQTFCCLQYGSWSDGRQAFVTLLDARFQLASRTVRTVVENFVSVSPRKPHSGIIAGREDRDAAGLHSCCEMHGTTVVAQK